MTKINPAGGSGRGTFCSPAWLAALIGKVDIDPCSNERSHIDATHRFSLATPEDDGLEVAARVSPAAKSYVNPPYNDGEVIKWVRAYRHTDFMFLLRFDSSTEWFAELLQETRYLWFAYRARIDFEAPAGVETSSNPFPHALYCKSMPNAALLQHGYVLEVTDSMRESLLSKAIQCPVPKRGRSAAGAPRKRTRKSASAGDAAAAAAPAAQ